MASIVCPVCGHEQSGGIQCRKCRAFLTTPEGLVRPARRASNLARPRFSSGLVRRTYQVLTWGSLAALLLSIVLVLRQPPPPKVAIDPQAAARVESKLREAESKANAGQPHQLRLDEAEVNAYLGSNLALKRDSSAQSGPPAAALSGTPSRAPAGAEPTLDEVQSSVKDIKINMLEDRVQAHVLFDFHGKDLWLMLEGRLHAQGGYLRFEPVAGKLGSMPIPQSTLEAAVQRLLTSPENKAKLRLPPDIGDIRIVNGELVVTHR